LNDPHVQALIYHLKHDEGGGDEKADPLEFETDDFSVRVADGTARFEMKRHFADPEEARKIVDPFVDAWILQASLDGRPGDFRLEYRRHEVIDRQPGPQKRHRVVRDATFPNAWTARKEHPCRYPTPPDDLAVDATVEHMSDRFDGYRTGQEPLGSMAYFCLTKLENAAKDKGTGGRNKRQAASQLYGIEEEVLDEIGRLSSEKGGRQGRKAGALKSDYTPAERQWLEEAIKCLIRRAAQVAHDPAAAETKITMSDLPPLDSK